MFQDEKLLAGSWTRGVEILGKQMIGNAFPSALRNFDGVHVVAWLKVRAEDWFTSLLPRKVPLSSVARRAVQVRG